MGARMPIRWRAARRVALSSSAALTSSGRIAPASTLEDDLLPINRLPTPPALAASGAYYRRPLSDDLVPFSSPRGRKLFEEAMEARSMESYWPLAEHFQCQAHPAFCGLTTLTMVLNSLEIDPGRPWKGPWRWFTEEMLDCCKPLTEIVRSGLSLREFATLARCQDAQVELHYASACSLDEFRDAIAAVCRPTAEGEPPSDRLVLSFCRQKIGQTGSGHFSPVAGYHPGEDRMLILDTARFKYPPFWVRVEMMWEAMRAQVQPDFPVSRGYMLIRKRKLPPSHCPTTIASFAAAAPRLRLCWSKALKHFLVSAALLDGGAPLEASTGATPADAAGATSQGATVGPPVALASVAPAARHVDCCPEHAGTGSSGAAAAADARCCTEALREQLELLFLSTSGNGSLSLAETLMAEAQRHGLDTARISEHLNPLTETETRRCVAATLRRAGYAQVVDLATLMVLAGAEYEPFRQKLGPQAAAELVSMHRRDMALESLPLLDEVLAYQVGKIRDQMHLLGMVPEGCLML